MGGIYKKNKGYADALGVKFQLDLVILSFLNGLFHHTNWRVSTENQKAGKFDDVVIELSDKTSILIQAKHKKCERNGVTKDQLLSTKKNAEFGLPKYFFSYQEIKNQLGEKTVIICTNTSLDVRGLEEMLTEHQIDKRNILYCRKSTGSFFKLKQNILPELKTYAEAYFDEHLKNGGTDRAIITDENLEIFLEKLQVFSSYPSGDDLQEVIDRLLSRLWVKISYYDVYRKVEEWLKQPVGEYLTEARVKGMLCEIISDKYCESLKDYKVTFERNEFNFDESKRIFHIKADGGYLLQMMKIHDAFENCKICKNKKLYVNSDDDVEALKNYVEAFGLHHYDILVMVIMKPPKEDVINEITVKLRETLEKHRNKKVILVANSDNKLAQQIGLKGVFQIDGSVMFRDLSIDTQKRLLNKDVIFQGKEINLDELLRTQAAEDRTKYLDTKPLAELVRRKEVKVGVQPLDLDKDVAPYYIPRTFERNIHEIERMGEVIPEERLYNISEKVILISDSAGMGKSTVLTKLAAHVSENHSHLWIIRINLNDYTAILRECLKRNKYKINLLELLNSRETTKITNPFEKFVFSMKEKVVLMCDGVDEISPDYTGLILGLLCQCQEAQNLSKIFVTTRPHVTIKLEAALKVASFKMLPFSRSNQVDFLTNYWSHKLQLGHTNQSKCKQYAQTLIDKMTSWIKSYHYSEINFAAIPMQVNMLAEIFQENTQAANWHGCKEYLDEDKVEPQLPDKFNIAELYDMFIRKKRDVFVEKGISDGNTVTQPALLFQFDGCLAHHRSLALKLILNEEEAKLFTNCHPKDEDTQEYVLKVGIVQKFGGEFQFIHRTFAEYFVAESIIQELKRQNASVEFQRVLIDKILVVDRFEIVCVFLDILLQKAALPTNVFKNYQSFSCDSNLNLIFHLARQGYVTIMDLILKSINFKIVRDQEITINDWRVKISLKKRNTLNDLKLLTRKAGVNIKNKSGNTPLHFAVRGGHLEMVRFLVKVGANLYISNSNCSIAPHLAAELGMFHITKYFVEYDPNVNHVRDDMGRTPLLLAAAHNRLNTVKYLLEHGAFLEDMDSEGCTSMHLAAKWGRLDTLDYLVQYGAIMETVDHGGRTPAHSAAKWAHLITLEYVVEHGGVMDIRDDEGYTPMDAAARWGRLNTLKYLVEHGAGIDGRDSKGCAAIHLTAKWGRLNTLQYLVEQGANINVRDSEGYTPLHLAVENNRLNIAKFLVKHGADVTIRDNKGRTALNLADKSNLINYFNILTPQLKIMNGVSVNVQDSMKEDEL